MTDIVLFGAERCVKTRFYQAALKDRGLGFELADVETTPQAAQRLIVLTGSPHKFPTFQIKGRKLRNPTLPGLDRVLARADLYDPGLIHEEDAQRFVRHMAPSDAFVSYQWRGDLMLLSHIQVDPSLRGAGVGSRLAEEVFEAVQYRPHPVRIACPFLRRRALAQPQWRERFELSAAVSDEGKPSA